jgi:hypothetical protein
MQLLLLLGAMRLSALEIAFRVTPELAIPAGGDSPSLYKLGFAGTVNVDAQFRNFLSVGPEFSYFYVPLNGTGTSIQFANAGVSVGAFAYPMSRVRVQLEGSGGAYQAMNDSASCSNLWWKIHGNASFRLTPSFNLAATGGYITFMYPGSPLYSALVAGVSGQLSIDTRIATGNVAVSLEQGEPVFPLFYGIYKQNSIGTLTLVNNETAEIRDVTVSFRAGDYTSSLLSCGSMPLLEKRKSVKLPLYADFSTTIQNFTENGKMPGEVVVSYKLLGDGRTASKTVVIQVYNRNTVRWTDKAVLASYISPNAPEVLDIGKYIVGIARAKLRTGLNRNMQFAMYVLEGLKVGGLSNSKDSTTPYVDYHVDPAKLDYIQYPFQTLAYHSGDLDDLGVLVSAIFESVGIRSAVIPLKDDFVVAFSLGIAPEDAKDLFASLDNLLTINDEVWIPLSMSVLREGFVNSWFEGMKKVNEAFSENPDTEVIILQEAWRTYPAATITGSEAQFAKPDQSAVARAVDTDLMRYISNEFGPKIRAIQDDIKAKGSGTAAQYNSLGLLYIRAGMYEEAKGMYQKSAALGSVPAMVNLGNISILQKDFKTAGVWFKKALELQPDNKGAKNGLDRVELELAD